MNHHLWSYLGLYIMVTSLCLCPRCLNLDLIYWIKCNGPNLTPQARRPEEGFYTPLNLFARLLMQFQRNLGRLDRLLHSLLRDTNGNFQHTSCMFSWGGPWFTPRHVDTFCKQFGRQTLCFEYERTGFPYVFTYANVLKHLGSFGYGSTPKLGLLITGWWFQTGRSFHNIW